MAKEHSFDISAKVDGGELKNALEQSKKEIVNRYDFKGLVAEVEYNETSKTITLLSSSDNKADAMKDIVISKMIKRSIPSQAIKELKRESVGAGNTRVTLQVVDVISSEEAKKIVKEIKTKKLKVQVSIRGEEVRVSAKSIDDLQTCMSVVRAMELEAPISFDNLT